MKRSFLREHGKSGLELVEEAFVLFRACPVALLAVYYVGSVPFAVGFLIFCSDLSRNPEASDHLGGATLAMTGLFIWMKCFHAQFCRMLLGRLRGDATAFLRPIEFLRSIGLQTIIQSTALFLLPVATISLLPVGWVYAFYQNVSSLDDGKTPLGALIRDAARQAQLWPRQNHVLLVALSSFGFFVFLNWMTLAFFMPQLVKMFFGIESIFTLSPLSMFNTTFFAATAVLTYLSVDPLIKGCYVLRCFYGKSLQTGDDLKAEVRKLSGVVPAVAVLLVFCLIAPVTQLRADTPAPTPAVTSSELDQSIETVIQKDKYTWRAPIKKTVEKKEGLLDGFFKSMFQPIKDAFKAMEDFISKIFKWIFHRDRSSSHSQNDPSWVTPQIGLLFVILAIVASLLTVAGMRTIRARRRSANTEGIAVATIPDLENENITAAELPEDDWTKMGRRFLEEGELRLALRAFYLASLAHLAGRSLITITRSKSNRDYERELRRRGHALPELPVLFSENVGIFDRIWYGLHEVNPDIVQRFIGNLDKMKGVT